MPLFQFLEKKQKTFNNYQRQKFIDLFTQYSHCFRVESQEVMPLFVNYMDRILSQATVPEHLHHLVAFCCYFLAAKYEEVCCYGLSMLKLMKNS